MRTGHDEDVSLKSYGDNVGQALSSPSASTPRLGQRQGAQQKRNGHNDAATAPPRLSSSSSEH